MEASPIGRPTYFHVCALGERMVWGHPGMARKVSQKLSGLSGFAITLQASQSVLSSSGERIWAVGLALGRLSKGSFERQVFWGHVYISIGAQDEEFRNSEAGGILGVCRRPACACGPGRHTPAPPLAWGSGRSPAPAVRGYRGIIWLPDGRGFRPSLI